MTNKGSIEGKSGPPVTSWLPGETIKPDGLVRMPEGFDITVIRSDMVGADELDPATIALIRNFPPPNPRALADLTKAAGLAGPDTEVR